MRLGRAIRDRVTRRAGVGVAVAGAPGVTAAVARAPGGASAVAGAARCGGRRRSGRLTGEAREASVTGVEADLQPTTRLTLVRQLDGHELTHVLDGGELELLDCVGVVRVDGHRTTVLAHHQVVVEGGAASLDLLVVELLEEHHHKNELLGCHQLLDRRTVHSSLCPVVDTRGIVELLEPRIQLEERLAARDRGVRQSASHLSTVVGLSQDVGVDVLHALVLQRGANRIGPHLAGLIRADHEDGEGVLLQLLDSVSTVVLGDEVRVASRVLPGQVAPQTLIERGDLLGVLDVRLLVAGRLGRGRRRRCCRGTRRRGGLRGVPHLPAAPREGCSEDECQSDQGDQPVLLTKHDFSLLEGLELGCESARDPSLKDELAEECDHERCDEESPSELVECVLLADERQDEQDHDDQRTHEIDRGQQDCQPLSLHVVRDHQNRDGDAAQEGHRHSQTEAGGEVADVEGDQSRDEEQTERDDGEADRGQRVEDEELGARLGVGGRGHG